MALSSWLAVIPRMYSNARRPSALSIPQTKPADLGCESAFAISYVTQPSQGLQRVEGWVYLAAGCVQSCMSQWLSE